MTNYNVSDLIVHASEERPSEFSAAFESLIQDRLQTAVEDKKLEMVGNLFGEENTPYRREGTRPPVTDKDKEEAVDPKDIPPSPPKPQKKPKRIANMKKEDQIGNLIKKIEGEE